ncbi:ceramide synthase isoform X3 [Salmo salar]|uniref:Ceramide synthase isoform X3 n=1 Tax=Salmo salar TaxID=8030 RepID=A0ABM3DIC3_SALSA|nr:ceramide synthase isoform X3 [Salmo salar]
MLTILAAGSVFFPGLFVLSKQCLKHIPALRWSEGDAVIVSARLVSSVQAIMASSAGYIIASSCDDIVEDQHWLTSAYILFAVPYFVYDIYAMFMCYWYKLRIKGHEADSGAKPLGAALTSYLRREFLMVLHHIVMVTVCFPVSVFWRQGKGDYFQGVMFLAEVSTPWVCLGKILIQDELIPEAAPRRRRQRRGTRPFPSTWFLSTCPGKLTWAQLCSWPPRSTGSPSFAEGPCDSSLALPAPGGARSPPRMSWTDRRRSSPPMGTALMPQSKTQTLTEKWAGG